MKYFDERMNINEALINVEFGNINPGDMFWDWFCTEKGLANRGKKLVKKLESLLGTKKFDPEKCYTFFKNNCPMIGNLYDDFRICDIETRDVLYTVTPSCGHTHNKGKAEVWGYENDFKEPLVSGTWKEVKQFFLGE